MAPKRCNAPSTVSIFVHSCASLAELDYPEKWQDIIALVDCVLLTAGKAKSIRMDMLAADRSVLEVVSVESKSMHRDVIAGDVCIYEHNTCPTCLEKSLSFDTAKRERPLFAKEVLVYRDDGASRNARVFSMLCPLCETVVFPHHRVMKDASKSKLPICAKYRNERFVQYSELTVVSTKVLQRFLAHIAVGSPDTRAIICEHVKEPPVEEN